MEASGGAPEPSAAEQAGERAARNMLSRVAGEFTGKFASLILFVVLGRAVGAADLGIFVFALAYGQIVVMAIDLGLDRYLVAIIARDRDKTATALPAAAAVKTALAIVVLPLSLAVLFAMGETGAKTIATVYILMLGTLFDSVNRLVAAIFVAHERNDLLVRGLIVERILAAVVGITLLALGAGIVPVSGAYTLGAGAGLVVSIVLVRRRIELPKFRFVRAEAKPLAIKSVPFAADDVLTALLFKLDAVLLAIISTDVAVGLYGAAYRLFESTLSIDYSLAGAFGAMYAYLSHDTEPTIQAVFQRSLKLALVTLVPFAVTFGALAEPIVRLLYGHELIGAAGPLRLLAPAQVMLGLITLSAILIVYRRSPVLSAAATGIAVVLNLALNLILIPHLDENGAALAMLITEAVFMVAAVTLALQNVGRIEVRTTVLGPLVAGGVMSVVMLALESQFLLALILGGLAYLGVLFLVERLSAPQDVRFVTELLRRRLRRRGAVA